MADIVSITKPPPVPPDYQKIYEDADRPAQELVHLTQLLETFVEHVYRCRTKPGDGVIDGFAGYEYFALQPGEFDALHYAVIEIGNRAQNLRAIFAGEAEE